MHKRKKILQIIWLYIGLLGLPINGNTQPYFFEQLPNQIGLTQSAVTAIHQDHEGYLWIGTWYGLARYDGYSIKLFQAIPNDATSLGNNKVTSIFEDSKQRLWVGTEYGGLMLYNHDRESFERYQHNPSQENAISNDHVLTIIEDRRDGTLWLGTEFGLNHFNPETNTFTTYLHEPEYENSLPNNYIRTLYQADDNQIWIGSKKGITILNTNADKPKFSSYNLAPNDITEPHLHNYIFKIIEKDNAYWIGTNAGLKKVILDDYDIQISHFESKRYSLNNLSNNFVPTLLPVNGNDSLLWVGTGDGLNILNTKTEIFTVLKSKNTNSQQLTNHYILSLFEDNTGVVWVGTNEGIYKLSQPVFSYIRPDISNTSNKNDITSISKSTRLPGTIWTGSMGGGISLINLEDEDNTTTHNFSIADKEINQLANFVYSITTSEDGGIWIGTRGAGLLSVKEEDINYDQSTILDYEQYSTSNNSVLKDDYIITVTSSLFNGVWMGCWERGIYFFDRAAKEMIDFDLEDNYQSREVQYPISRIMEEIDGKDTVLWVISRGGGVHQLKFEPSTKTLIPIIHFTEKNGLTSNFSNIIFKDKDGLIWIGGERGLSVIKEGKVITTFGKEDGLEHDLIQHIIQDDNGTFWVSTNRGIYSFEYSSGNIGNVQSFDIHNGLQEEFFHSGSGVYLSNNYLVFGGVEGLTCFDPNDFNITSSTPKVVFTDFKLFNESVKIGEKVNKSILLRKSINEQKQITLKHRDNVFTIAFSGLHFLYPEKNKYAYQLEGFDKDWIYTDATRRTAHYTNLSQGTYTFKVKATNASGVWGEEKRLIISIRPPLWLTWWACLFYGIAFIGVLYGVRVITLMRVNFNNKLELERLEREKLEEVNDLKLQFYTDVSHDLRTPLTLLISPLEDLLKKTKADFSTKNTLLLMHKNATRLMRMINQLLDFRKDEVGMTQLSVSQHDMVIFLNEIVLAFQELAKQRNITLVFNTDLDALPLWFDDKHFEKVIYNLLSNGFKFTADNGTISVGLSATDNEALVTITDTGEGIPKSELPYIFDRFYQVKHKDISRHGTGIGLALAKRVVQNHKGQIAVVSKLNEGTTFSISLLRGKSHFQDKLIQENQEKRVAPFAPIATIAEHNIVTATLDATAPTILIVEDNVDIRSYLKLKLSDTYNILEANNGKVGLEIAFETPPQLVISDISMPEMDGIEFCKLLKTNIQTSHIPVILLTARTSLVYQLSGLETGADDYITKPFDMEILTIRIQNLIESRQSLRERYAKNMLLKPSNIVVNSLDEAFLKKTIALIEEHIDDNDYTVEKLSHDLHISRMNFYRKIKALTNTTPNIFIRKIKMQRAAQLLKSKQYTITEVTYMVGFSDLKYFRKKFKEEFGVSPSSYE